MINLTPERLDELQAVAEAILDVPWDSVPSGAWTGRVFAGENLVAKTSNDVPDDHCKAEYIAAFDPPTVLAMIRQLREAEEVAFQQYSYGHLAAQVEWLKTMDTRNPAREADFDRWLSDVKSDAKSETEAAIQRVRELHRRAPVYLLDDECECSDRDTHQVIESEHGESLCVDSPTGEEFCQTCTHDGDDEPTEWPCPTVRALDGEADGER